MREAPSFWESWWPSDRLSVVEKCVVIVSIEDSRVRQRGGVLEAENLCCGRDSNTLNFPVL